MAVESFLPVSDVKITIEKQVKEKPSIAELTTIESPGRTKDTLENSQSETPTKKKTRQKAAKPTSQAKTQPVPQDLTLILTEKPQAAAKIAAALGNARQYKEANVSFYELVRDNKKIIVASAVGHLFGLTYAKGQTGWPIFNMIWEPAFKRAPFTKRYYDLIKNLAPRIKDVIIATDYDIEGEVIGWNVLRFILKRENAKRMKYSTLTKPELEKSYEQALPELDWGQAYAGETRHHVDWLYGINLSRALMSAIKTTGQFKILSVGRVQGPALKLIVDREREIKNFKPVPYWQIFAKVGDTLFKHVKDIFNESELEQFKDIKEAIADTKTKDEKLAPPFPFDLTSLQREAYAWHKISPSNTLKIAQTLYLDGIISYPRTSSQKIPREINPKDILKKLSRAFPQTEHASRSMPIEGPKSDPAHPSIYPTGELKTLNPEEKKIYDLVVKRFIAAFCADALLKRKTATLTANDKKFTASGTVVKDAGWMNVYPSTVEEFELADFNGPTKVDEISNAKKETIPPYRYTPASLITILEKKNLGTKSTRSSIIDTLFDRGYLEGKSIEATPLGVKLIESLEKYSPIIIDENLTRDLEEKMEDILLSKSEFKEKENAVIANVQTLINNISKEFKLNESAIGQSLMGGVQELREQQKEESIIMPCTVCGKGNLAIRFSKKTKRYFAACDKYPECKSTYSLPPNSLIKTTGKTVDGLPVLVALRKGRRPWEFTFNPNYKKPTTSS